MCSTVLTGRKWRDESMSTLRHWKRGASWIVIGTLLVGRVSVAAWRDQAAVRDVVGAVRGVPKDELRERLERVQCAPLGGRRDAHHAARSADHQRVALCGPSDARTPRRALPSTPSASVGTLLAFTCTCFTCAALNATLA